MLERNILAFSGIKPIKTTLIGSIEDISEMKRLQWMRKMQMLGESGN